MTVLRGVAVIALVLPALLLTSAPVAAFCEILEPPSALPTQVNGTQVEIRLTEGFAQVVIIKEFYNPSDVPKQGQIFFPLERGHELITDLRLKIGNVVYNSSVGDRGGALDDFLTAIAQGQDAALVQYDPPRDVYWIEVTIPPREARTTITTLEMPLTKRDGSYEYHYRLSVDARDSVAYLRVHVRVETATPLTHIHIMSHPDVPIVRAGDRVADAYINDTATAQGRDLNLHFGSASTALAQFVDAQGDRFVRYAVDVSDQSLSSSLSPMPRSLLLAVDASGSMGRDDRWNIAKDAVVRLGEDLHPGETLGLVAFGGPSVTVYDRDLREWTPQLGTDLLRFLERMTPHGSTSYAAPLSVVDTWARQAAGRGQQPVFILISDGRLSRGLTGLDLETDYSRIAYDRTMPIFALAARPSDHADETLLRNLSHFQGGDLFSVYGGEIAAQVSSLLTSIRVPVLLGVQADIPLAAGVEFANPNPQTVLEGSEAVVLAKLPGAIGDQIAIRLGWTGPDGPHAMERNVAGTSIPVQSLIGRQWLLTRIHGMLATLRAHEDPSVVEVLKVLATEHRVVTPYTSLLVTIPRAGSDAGIVAAPQTDVGLQFGGGIVGEFGPAATASRGQFSGGFVTPLEAEGRRGEALRRDLANPLVADGELDRVVYVGSPDYARIDQRTAISRFDGTYVRVLEVGDELVGIFPDDFQALHLHSTGFGLALAVLSVAAFLFLRRRRP